MQNSQSVDKVRYSSAISTVQVDNCHLQAKAPHDPESRVVLQVGLVVEAVCLELTCWGAKTTLDPESGTNSRIRSSASISACKSFFLSHVPIYSYTMCVCVCLCVW